MAWSIFTDGGGDAAAVAWAQALILQLGVPETPANVQFVYDWERSEGGGGKYNPLNQGPVPGRPDLTTTGQQFGGGAADYASPAAGIIGAVIYLHYSNYAAVLAALRDGQDYARMARALWDSPWASGHYGYGASWSTAPLPGRPGAAPAFTPGPGAVPAGPQPATPPGDDYSPKVRRSGQLGRQTYSMVGGWAKGVGSLRR